MPGQSLPKDWPDFPSFAQYAEYLQNYANNFHIQYSTKVTNAAFDQDEGLWNVSVNHHDILCTLHSRHLVVASGWYVPSRANEVQTQGFDRPVYDANEVHDAESFRGKTVLIVGMGNTGADVGMGLVAVGAKVIFGIRSIPTISSVKVAGARLHDVAKCES